MNSESKRKLHQYVEVEEVGQLKKRVAYLEEETHVMMREMSQNTAERKSLLKDIYRQLKLIQFSCHPKTQNIMEYKFCKQQEGGRGDGLSQVLYEDLNPTVVIRGGLTAHSMATSSEHAKSTMSNILCIECND
ncbi:unnamed protein product [Lactuca saligna]|uniref:Uncharacterized protein n=1 Tax=Lactuca saligna TaxID=75948 RepID=A0AA36E3V0_LACSI|nr:unnamed protein product [Lactuca saligna]